MKNDPRQWPKLSQSLPHPRNPDTCQACGLRRTLDVGLGPALEIWREHDHQDAATPIVVVLCHGCAERLIEPHPRLYDRQPANKPVPGCILHLCLECRHRDGVACRHPDLKTNGGPGLNICVVPPSRCFWDGRGKDGRRTGGLREIWPSPASACAGREVPAPQAPEPEEAPEDE